MFTWTSDWNMGSEDSDMRIYKNSTYAFIDALKRVLKEGKQVTVRGMKTLELRQEAITIRNPMERCIVLPHRNDNIFAKVAETLWMIQGRNDIQWLKHYLPRAPGFADDGEHWRGGYGPRLRNWRYGETDADSVDQLHYVVNLLNKDPESRQAVISIWDPSIDTNPGKDIPCNNWIHFLIRDKMLHMSVAQRSSDIMWGFSGIDAFSWSVLHQMMAHWTGCTVGDLSWFFSSWHLYERHWKQAEQILKSFTGRTIYDNGDCFPATFSTSFEDTDHIIGKVMQSEVEVRDGVFIEQHIDDILLMECLDMLWLYNGGNTLPGLVNFINMMNPYSDFRVAAIEYYTRKFPKLPELIDVTPEQSFVLSSVLTS